MTKKTMNRFLTAFLLVLLALLNIRPAHAGHWEFVRYEGNASYHTEEIAARHYPQNPPPVVSEVHPRDIAIRWTAQGTKVWLNGELVPEQQIHNYPNNGGGVQYNNGYPVFHSPDPPLGLAPGKMTGTLSIHAVFHWIRNQIDDGQGHSVDDPNDPPTSTIYIWQFAKISGGEGLRQWGGNPVPYGPPNPYPHTEHTFSRIGAKFFGDNNNLHSINGWNEILNDGINGNYAKDSAFVMEMAAGRETVNGLDCSFNGQIDLANYEQNIDDRNGGAGIGFDYLAAACSARGYLPEPKWSQEVLQPDGSLIVYTRGYVDLGQNEFVMNSDYSPFKLPCRTLINELSVEPQLIDSLRVNADWLLSRSLPNPLPRSVNSTITDPPDTHLQLTPQTITDPVTNVVKDGLYWSQAQGLPASNGDFGLRTLEFRLLGRKIDEAELEIFYPTFAHNHPLGGDRYLSNSNPGFSGTNVADDSFDADADDPDQSKVPPRVPNWFHYYRQAYPGDVPLVYDFWGSTYGGSGFRGSYTQNGDPHFLEQPMQGYIHIGDEGTHGKFAHRLWRKNFGGPTPVASNVSRPVVMVGWQTTYGLDTWVSVITHERAHMKCREACVSGMTDTDKDGLPDLWEEEIGTNPNVQDTANFSALHPNYTDYADQDIYCQISEEAVAGTVDRNKDWASDGLNAGRVPGNGTRCPIEWINPTDTPQ